ncbi:hypothetical protein B0H14DRAFT_3027073, partial [Mycena olivaceomarginata]
PALSQLYPCGESASEFQMLLKKYPLQVRNFDTLYRRLPRGFLHQFGLCSRPCISSGFNSAQRAAHRIAIWLLSLVKPQFDCAHLDDTYDCGCGDKPLGNNPDRIPKPDPMDSGRDGMKGG